MFEHLTVEENLKARAHLRKGGAMKEGLEMVYYCFSRLRDKLTETAGFISGVKQQITGVGRALMTSLGQGLF